MNYAGQILVVDDDAFVREMLEAKLEEAGFRVTLAENIEQLKARLTERFFDFVLLDLFLANESGLDALPYVVSQSPRTRILMMSAHGTIQFAVDAMEKGAASFLCKSKNAEELVEAIKKRISEEKEKSSGPQSKESYGIIGKSEGLVKTLALIEQLKDVDSTVLITGESGTGKELVARALHEGSTRREARFEAINCAAIPETLLEAELFGHKRGAFTDAKTDRKGLFELCSGGTLFLDEIGEMPPSLQAKLLRVLQEKVVQPLGGGMPVPVDTRVVAATNRNLQDEVREGRFRLDLFYRLTVFQINVPALRERRGDISLLIHHFLDLYNRRFNRNVRYPGHEVESRLLTHAWHGNIRELQNVVERGVVLSKDGEFHLDAVFETPALAQTTAASPGSDVPLNELLEVPLTEAKRNFERVYLNHVLNKTKGNISEIARLSGRYRTDIYRLMSKYDVELEEFRE